MGLFSGGDKKTVATQLTAGAQTQAGDPVSVSISGKANSAHIVNNMTDYGAIGGALTLADGALTLADNASSNSIALANNGIARSFDFAEGFGSEVLNFSKAIIDKSNQGAAAAVNSVRSSSEGAIKQIANYAESQSLNNDERITKIALWGVGIVAAVAVGPQLIAAFKG